MHIGGSDYPYRIDPSLRLDSIGGLCSLTDWCSSPEEAVLGGAIAEDETDPQSPPGVVPKQECYTHGYVRPLTMG